MAITLKNDTLTKEKKTVKTVADYIISNDIKLVILQGAPGSGKTTFAQNLTLQISSLDLRVANACADDFFTVYEEAEHGGYNPVYKFDINWIKEAHEYCRSNVARHIFSGRIAIVHNTFTQDWEIDPYIELAKKAGIKYAIIRMDCDYGNIHNCPEEVVNKMKQRMTYLRHKPNFIIKQNEGA